QLRCNLFCIWLTFMLPILDEGFLKYIIACAPSTTSTKDKKDGLSRIECSSFSELIPPAEERDEPTTN
ncbi:unnamed protein product, partial [Arabidopsis halleri]